MARRHALSLAAASVCAALVTSASAATYTWTQCAANTFNWGDSANWSSTTDGPSAGGAADAIVQFRPVTMPDNSGTVTVNAFNNLSGEFALNQLSLGNNQWGGNGNNISINVQGGTLQFNGSNAAIAFNTDWGIVYNLQNNINFSSGSTTAISTAGTNPTWNITGAWLGSGSVNVTPATTTGTFVRPYNAGSNFTGSTSITRGTFRIYDGGTAGVTPPTAQSIPLGSAFSMGSGTTLAFYRGDTTDQGNTYAVGTNISMPSGGTLQLTKSTGANGASLYNLGTLSLGADGQTTVLAQKNGNYYWGSGKTAFTSTTVNGNATVDVSTVTAPSGNDSVVSLGPTTLSPGSSLTLKQWHSTANSWQGSYIRMGTTTVQGNASLTIASVGAAAAGSSGWTLPQLAGSGTLAIRNQSVLSVGLNATPSTAFTGTLDLEAGQIDDRSATNKVNPALSTNLVVGGTGKYILWRQLGLGTDPTKTITVNAGGLFQLNQDSTVSYAPAYVPQTVYLNGGTLAADFQGNNHGYTASVGGLSVSGNSVVDVAGYLTAPSLTGSGTLTKTNPGAGSFVEQGTFCVAGASPLFSGTIDASQGILRLDNPDSLGTAHLIVEPTGSVNLAFTGTDVISSLTIGGTTYTAGGPYSTFGSLTSSADFKSAQFTGTGIIAVPEPALATLVPVAALALRRKRRA